MIPCLRFWLRSWISSSGKFAFRVTSAANSSSFAAFSDRQLPASVRASGLELACRVPPIVVISSAICCAGLLAVPSVSSAATFELSPGMSLGSNFEPARKLSRIVTSGKRASSTSITVKPLASFVSKTGGILYAGIGGVSGGLVRSTVCAAITPANAKTAIAGNRMGFILAAPFRCGNGGGFLNFQNRAALRRQIFFGNRLNLLGAHRQQPIEHGIDQLRFAVQQFVFTQLLGALQRALQHFDALRTQQRARAIELLRAHALVLNPRDLFLHLIHDLAAGESRIVEQEHGVKARVFVVETRTGWPTLLGRELDHRLLAL